MIEVLNESKQVKLEVSIANQIEHDISVGLARQYGKSFTVICDESGVVRIDLGNGTELVYTVQIERQPIYKLVESLSGVIVQSGTPGDKDYFIDESVICIMDDCKDFINSK